MSAPKIKNLVILVLALVNLFLLSLVLPTRLADLRSQRAADANLISLYAEAGVKLEQIPASRPLTAMELSYGPDAGLAAARAVLGEIESMERDGSLTVCTSPAGEVSLEDSGMFFARLSRPKTDDPAAETEQLLAKMGAAYDTLLTVQSADAEEYTAVLLVDGVCVLSHRLTFRYEAGCLTRISGLLPPAAEPAVAGGDVCISARDALVALLSSRLGIGWMGSRIESVTQGYRLSADPARLLWTMQPAWRIETDAGNFFVDGITGAVTAAS